MIDTLSNGQWNTIRAPLPPRPASANKTTSLDSVACTSTTSCVAVGNYPGGVLIETLTDGTWAATEGPVPVGGSGGALDSISCASASFCIAVGQFTDSGGTTAGLIETLDNGTWTAGEAPAPAGGSSEPLLAVSCGAVGFCAAVSEFNAALDMLTNGSWTAAKPPLPANAGGQGESLNSIACRSVDSCVAVGRYQLGQGLSQGLFETLANGTWTATEAPLPAGADTTDSASFNSVTCSNAQSCQAVGIYNEAVEPDWGDGVIDTLSNGSWASASSGNSADFNAASCTATSCIAAGHYGAETDGLIDTGSGGTWIATEPTLPANASSANSSEASLTSVSCATTGFCAAIGWYKDSGGTEEGLVETGSPASGVLPTGSPASSILPTGSPASSILPTSGT